MGKVLLTDGKGAYVHTYIPTYLYTYIRTYLHTYTRTYVYTYIPTYLPVPPIVCLLHCGVCPPFILPPSPFIAPQVPSAGAGRALTGLSAGYATGLLVPSLLLSAPKARVCPPFPSSRPFKAPNQ